MQISLVQSFEEKMAQIEAEIVAYQADTSSDNKNIDHFFERLG